MAPRASDPRRVAASPSPSPGGGAPAGPRRPDFPRSSSTVPFLPAAAAREPGAGGHAARAHGEAERACQGGRTALERVGRRPPHHFALLGVGIAVEGRAAAPVLAALAPLATPARGPPALRFVAEPADAPGTPPEPAVFAHAPVRAGRAGDALVVGDATARFTIRAGGRRVDAALAPGALAEGASLVAALHAPIALAFALRHHHVFHLHAAALALGGRAVLVAGQALAGKTTLAMALLEAGLDALCDDAAYLAAPGGALRVQGVARPFHLRPDTARAFRRAAALAGPPDPEGRRDLDPAAAWGPPRRGPLAPGLLLFPEVAPRRATAVEALAPSEALGRLVEASALVVVDGAAHAAEHLALLGRLASEAPALRVALGEDLLRTPVPVARAILRAGALRDPNTWRARPPCPRRDTPQGDPPC